MKKLFRLSAVISFFMTIGVSAAHAEDGKVTTNLLGVFAGIGSMFSGICIVVGIGLVFASFIQYRQHRANKLLVPISKPIVLLILGIFLACIPLLGHYAPGGQLVNQAVGS